MNDTTSPAFQTTNEPRSQTSKKDSGRLSSNPIDLILKTESVVIFLYNIFWKPFLANQKPQDPKSSTVIIEISQSSNQIDEIKRSESSDEMEIRNKRKLNTPHKILQWKVAWLWHKTVNSKVFRLLTYFKFFRISESSYNFFSNSKCSFPKIKERS